jgi:hypothetical protein
MTTLPTRTVEANDSGEDQDLDLGVDHDPVAAVLIAGPRTRR